MVDIITSAQLTHTDFRHCVSEPLEDVALIPLSYQVVRFFHGGCFAIKLTCFVLTEFELGYSSAYVLNSYYLKAR